MYWLCLVAKEVWHSEEGSKGVSLMVEALALLMGGFSLL